MFGVDRCNGEDTSISTPLGSQASRGPTRDHEQKQMQNNNSKIADANKKREARQAKKDQKGREKARVKEEKKQRKRDQKKQRAEAPLEHVTNPGITLRYLGDS